MSSYTAIIHCVYCKRILAGINAKHENKHFDLIPQDIVTKEFYIDSMFCQNCLNKRGVKND